MPKVVLVSPDKNLARDIEPVPGLICCATAAEADRALVDGPADVIVCQDRLEGEPGIMFLARHVGDTPWTQRILICAPLEPEVFLQVINEARVLQCIIEPCDPDALRRAVRKALDEAGAARLRFEASLRAGHPAKLAILWLQALPRLAMLTLITCGGVFLAGLATLLLLYVLKSLAGIDIFPDAHLRDLWR